jgi:peroxiredoxin
MNRLIPRQATPELSVETLNGPWTLSEQTPENFSMIVVYRGYHCPICKMYVSELNKLLEEFETRAVSVLALSSDTRERAQLTADEWQLDKLTIGYGLTAQQSAEWGLFRSSSRGKTSLGIEEPAQFTEPGLYLVRPDGTLYWSNISTMPFARPHFREIVGALDFALKNDYPARGELI